LWDSVFERRKRVVVLSLASLCRRAVIVTLTLQEILKEQIAKKPV
jgi:hypothetical protein